MVNEKLKDGEINLNVFELPREREDLWTVKFMKGFDSYIMSAYFKIYDGLYLKFTKGQMPTCVDGKLRMKDFPEDFLKQIYEYSKEEHVVELIGCDRQGEITSKILVHLKPGVYLISNTTEDVVLKFMPSMTEKIFSNV